MLDQIKIEEIIDIARKAGDAIMEIYAKDFSVHYKDDNSPLTDADKKANDIITERLNNLSVKLPILSEEGKEIPYAERRE